MNNDSESLALSRIWKPPHKAYIILPNEWVTVVLDAKEQRDRPYFASVVVESLRIKPLTKPNC